MKPASIEAPPSSRNDSEEMRPANSSRNDGEEGRGQNSSRKNRNEAIWQKYIAQHNGRRLFDLGDIACAWGALYAGCTFYAGYPITPASEIAEFLSKELPRAGGRFIQMEDEIASMAAVVGAAWAGARSMTATSGPGFSLMQENLGYAMMTETPCVVVDVQRSGPSTGQATKPAQGDMMQARWGTHGDHESVALCPNSAQECFDLTVRAFDIAHALRMPVLVMMDGEVGHLRETFDLRAPEGMTALPAPPDPHDFPPFGGNPVPPAVLFGEGRFLHVTGSTHKPDGMRDVTTPSVHDELVRRLCRKVEQNRHLLKDVEKDVPAGSKTVVLCYGAPSRPALAAVQEARKAGRNVGILRLRTVWPFPGDELEGLPGSVGTVLVPEMNLGQLSREAERCTDAKVRCLSKIGGVTHTKREILAAIEEAP
jgi:2-oxoglutarate ferredoxin oxidoreductase subunit alpha